MKKGGLNPCEWISIKDKSPDNQKFIVVIMETGLQQEDDPVEYATFEILRNEGRGEWRTLSGTGAYYEPLHRFDIEYWIPWDEFPFPESMIQKKDKA